MEKEKIEKFIDHQQRISDRNYRNYQETGDPRYERTYHKADALIEIAQQALAAADDHAAVINHRTELSDWGYRAFKLLHAWREEDAVQLIKDIAATAKLRGLAKDPYN